MAGINRGRLVGAGLAAGVVLNLFEIVCGAIFAKPWQEALTARGLTPPEGLAPFSFYLLIGFVAGMTIVWIYVAARARYGPGPRTAVTTGVVYWLGAYALSLAGFVPLGLYPLGMLAGWAAIGLLGVVAAAVVGAWVYRED
jgi:hypothetical protein